MKLGKINHKEADNMKYAKGIMLAFFIVFGCTKTDILVTVGSEKYTVDDFNSRIQFAPTDDSLKRVEKVDEFVNQMLVVYAAQEQGYEKDPVVTVAYDNNRKDIVTRGYYEAMVINKIKISDYDAKKLYDQFIDQYHLAQIVVSSESLAKFIGSELKRGVAFDALVKFSLDTLTKNGDIGSFSVLSLPPEILEVVKKTNAGSTAEPVLFGQFYYILKVIEHKKVDTPKFDEVKENIKNSLLREKALEMGEKFTNGIIEKAKVEYNEEGFNILLKPESLITENELDTWVVKKVKRNDTSYVRARSVIDAVQYQYQRSSIDPKILVQRALLPDLLYDEAIDAGAEHYPTIKKDLQNAMTTLLYQKYYSDNVLEKIIIDSAAVKAYFDVHKDEHKGKKLGDVYTLINGKLREQMVDSLRKNLFMELRKKYNPVMNETVLSKLLKETK